jgi:L-aspartate oxidase
MVFGHRAATHSLQFASEPLTEEEKNEAFAEIEEQLGEPMAVSEGQEVVRRIRKIMQRNVGIVRTTAGLLQAREQIEAALNLLKVGLASDMALWEARNIAQVAWLIVESALQRHESRGLHYVLDYPEPVESERHDTVLVNQVD